MGKYTAIDDPSAYFQTALYTGAGANQTVTNDGNSDLQPDLPLEEIWQLHLTSLSYQPWHPRYNPHAKANYKRKDIADYLWKLNEKTTMIAKSHEF